VRSVPLPPSKRSLSDTSDALPADDTPVDDVGSVVVDAPAVAVDEGAPTLPPKAKAPVLPPKRSAAPIKRVADEIVEEAPPTLPHHDPAPD
jgi:hypothetical protein